MDGIEVMILVDNTSPPLFFKAFRYSTGILCNLDLNSDSIFEDSVYLERKKIYIFFRCNSFEILKYLSLGKVSVNQLREIIDSLR